MVMPLRYELIQVRFVPEFVTSFRRSSESGCCDDDLRPAAGPARAAAVAAAAGPAPSWPTASTVTERTIRNDIERLRALDYPVHADARPRGRLPAGRLRPAAAAAALRRRSRGGRRGPDRRRGERGPRRAHPDRDREAGAHPARPAADPGAVVAGEHRRRSGQHRHERGRSRRSTPSCWPSSPLAVRAPGGTPLLVPRRRGRSRPTRTGWSAGSSAGTSWPGVDRRATGRRSGRTGCGSACRGQAASPRIRSPGGDYASFVLRDVASTGWAVHARILVDAPAAEVLRRINPTVGVVETVDDDAQRAGHRRRQPGDRGRLDRHARPAFHVDRAARAGRARPAAGRALSPPRCQPTGT